MFNKANNSLPDKHAKRTIFPKGNGWKQRSGGSEGSKDSDSPKQKGKRFPPPDEQHGRALLLQKQKCNNKILLGLL